MFNPEGTKKLVPATRSRIRSKQAGISTAKASSEMHEVMNQAQLTMGMRAKVIPLVRKSKVVAMKFRAPSSEAIQNTKIDRPQRVCPTACPGPGSPPTALRGAYAVQPDNGGPSPTKNAETKMQNATKVVQNDIMLKRGKAISSAPIWIGRK